MAAMVKSAVARFASQNKWTSVKLLGGRLYSWGSCYNPRMSRIYLCGSPLGRHILGKLVFVVMMSAAAASTVVAVAADNQDSFYTARNPRTLCPATSPSFVAICMLDTVAR